MKKSGIINHDLSEVISRMGHTDMLTVCDAGLPIPDDNWRIDLALKKGQPGLEETLEVIAVELQVERAIVASEMLTASPHIEQVVRRIFPDSEIQTISHTEFKQLSHQSKAFVRTGEFTPYANVILVSGIWGF
jgi:D-ribose pyranase